MLHKAAELIKAMHEEADRVFATKMLAERLALAGEADEAIAMAREPGGERRRDGRWSGPPP